MSKVKVYSTPTCPYCTIAKKYFDDHNVSYEDYDVANDEAKAKEMQEKSGQMGVPVLIIDDKGKENIIVGFDKQKVDEILKI